MSIFSAFGIPSGGSVTPSTQSTSNDALKASTANGGGGLVDLLLRRAMGSQNQPSLPGTPIGAPVDDSTTPSITNGIFSQPKQMPEGSKAPWTGNNPGQGAAHSQSPWMQNSATTATAPTTATTDTGASPFAVPAAPAGSPRWDRWATAQRMMGDVQNGWNPNPVVTRITDKVENS